MAQEDAIWALGCMSGTSMDGVDAAMVLTDGIEVFEFGATGFRPYSADERATIAAALGHWPDETGVKAAEKVVLGAHSELIARFGGVELVGFHGQTLAHDPEAGRTHQAGDGVVLARQIGLPVVWDFRTADVNAGGQGAPLAPFYHYALARRLGAGPIAFLNLGGVGNVTFVNPLSEGPEAKGALLAFDTGPANALMDDFILKRTGLACDYGGAMAAAGVVDDAIVTQFLKGNYFASKPPKSLDRNDFIALAQAVEHLNDMDGLATLAAATLRSVAMAFDHAPSGISRVLVCGGGRKNAHLMAGLSAVLKPEVEDIASAGFDGDMLEAQAFAYLAVRSQKAMSLSAPGTTGVSKALTGGRLARP